MAGLPPGDQARIEAAKKKGVYKGRKPSVPVAKAREMREAGQGPTAIEAPWDQLDERPSCPHRSVRRMPQPR